MTTFTRVLSAPADQVLDALENAARTKYKKANIALAGDTLTVETKVLWQTQTTTFTATGTSIEATGNNVEADGRAVKLLHEIDALLDDQGWSEAIESLGTTSVKSQMVRDQVLAVLDSGEQVVAATQGLELKKTCILVATQKRIIMLEKATAGFSSNDRTIPLDKISAISSSKKMLFGAVEITTSNETIEVEKVANDEVDAFVSAVRKQMNTPSPTAAQPSTVAAVDPMEQLTKLAELHATGVLTDDEFAAAKAKALGL